LIFVAIVATFICMKSAKVYRRNRIKKPFEVKFWNDDGKRVSISFANKIEADAFAKERNNEHKLPPQLQFTTQERIEFAKFREIAIEKDMPLTTAVQVAADYLKRLTSKKTTFAELFADYLSLCAKRQMRPSTQSYYRQSLDRFGKFIGGDTPIHEIDTLKIQTYLLSIGTREHAKRVLSAFFQYAKEREYIPQNLVKNISLPKALSNREIPKILTPTQTEENLQSLPDEYKPAFALMAFCGVRPDEICNDVQKSVVKWEDINFDTKKITIRADVAKTRTARIISDAPENVWEWLSIDIPPHQKSENIFPRSYSTFRIARRNMPNKLTHDVFRHSFASYAYHYMGIEKAVEIMGQEGGFAVYKKHYKSIATIADSRKYFSILPTKRKFIE